HRHLHPFPTRRSSDLRLARATSMQTVYGDDAAAELEAAASTPAAVLVPIIAHREGPTVLFTRRTVHLKAHSGQVSFPGGRAEPRSEEHTSELQSRSDL